MNSTHALPEMGSIAATADPAARSPQPEAANPAADTAAAAAPQKAPRSESQVGVLNKVLLLDHMRQLHIALAVVSYEGGGDEGTTTGVELVMESGQGETTEIEPLDAAAVQVSVWRRDLRSRARKKLAFKLLAMSLQAALEETVWSLVLDECGGFYNGCGGAGEVRFRMDTQTVLLAHKRYYTASKYSETLV